MLSRIAESLYWLGRYVERSEDTARILDVHYHLLLEDLSIDEASACSVLLEIMGLAAPPGGGQDSETVTRLLAFDPDHTASIVGSVSAAWTNARGIREAVSSEMWECLNATYQALGAQVVAARAEAPHAFFGWVKSRAAMLGGLADSTLSHDDGWRFFVLGRSLERVDMTARLLSARYGDAWGHSGWITTLRCCSAYEAYLRTYRRAVDGSLAAEFLLLDRLFPRSVFCALSQAEACLAEIDPSARRAGVVDDARRHLGRARTTLEFGSGPDLVANLGQHLTRVQADCARAGTAIAERYFRHTAAVAWSA
ncbi:MAG: alpha-E domain-containing protein [Acidimicrobiales bacterium]